MGNETHDLEESLHVVQQTVDALRAHLLAAEKSGSDALRLTARLDELLVIHEGILADFARRGASPSSPATPPRSRSQSLVGIDPNHSEFIALIAQEFRTPLTSIGGYLELFADGRFGDVPAEMVRPLGSIQRNTSRLRHLVEEMLEVSRIDTGQLQVGANTTELSDLVRELTVELAPLAKAKGQSLRSEGTLTGAIRGDRDKLRRAIGNLVRNAIRQSPPASKVQIVLDQAPAELMRGPWLRLRVRDGNPAGLSAGDRQRMFERNFTDAARDSSDPDAVGLTLFIARSLIEAYGGVVSVESQPGAYTEFTVMFPRAPHVPVVPAVSAGDLA